MTYKEAVSYLYRIKNLDDQITRKVEQVEILFTRATKTNCALTGEVVQSSGSGDKVGDLITQACDLDNEVNRDIDTLVDMKSQMMKEIKMCVDHDLKSIVLIERFVHLKSLTQIALELDFTVRYIQRLQTEGIQMFSERFAE